MSILNDELKFGKYKGQTWKEICRTEKGLQYAIWYINQPCQNPKYAKRDAEIKQELRQYIESLGSKTEPDQRTSSNNNQGHLVQVIAELGAKVDKALEKLDVLLMKSIAPKEEETKAPENIAWDD